MFGEDVSESPRVPSPWATSRKPSGQSRTSASSPKSQPRLSSNQSSYQAKAASLGPDSCPSSSPSPSSSTHSPSLDPLTPSAVSQRCLDTKEKDQCDRKKQNIGALLNRTGEVGNEEEEDGFFSLEADLALDGMDARKDLETSRCISEHHQTTIENSKTPQLQGAPTPAIAVTAPRGGHPSARLRPEPDSLGNLEYKLRLLPNTRHRYDRLLTQLKWRLLQGGGLCTYEIGVLDDGRCVGICEAEMRGSLNVLSALAGELDAGVRVRRAFVPEGSSLRILDNDEARKRLLDANEFDGCGGTCMAAREMTGSALPQSAVPGTIDSQSLGNISTTAGFLDGLLTKHPYIVDVQEEQVDDYRIWSLAAGDDTSSALRSESPSNETRENDLGAEVFDFNAEEDEDFADDFTFSLSLDERETRDGIGSKKPARRIHDRHMDTRILGLVQEDEHEKETNKKEDKQARPKALKHSFSDTPVETGLLKPSDNDTENEASIQNGSETANSSADQATKHPWPCQRLIVEAILSRSLGKDAYIDFASL